MSKLAAIDDPTSREPQKKKSLFHQKVVRPIKKNPLISVSAILIALSTLLLSVLLIAGSGSVYLSKFVFDDPIRFITKKSSITFTLYGHCVDDKCTKPSMVYRFDQSKYQVFHLKNILFYFFAIAVTNSSSTLLLQQCRLHPR